VGGEVGGEVGGDVGGEVGGDVWGLVFGELERFDRLLLPPLLCWRFELGAAGTSCSGGKVVVSSGNPSGGAIVRPSSEMNTPGRWHAGPAGGNSWGRVNASAASM
jgi:hypothetical protein